MDGEILGLLAIVAFYVLQAFLGRKKKAAQQLPSAEGAQQGPVGELGEALAEIRRMMQGEDEPAPAPLPAPLPAPPADPSDAFHRVVTGRPDAEARFESAGSEWRSPVKEDWHTSTPVRKPSPRPAPFRPAGSMSEDRFEAAGPMFRDPLVGHTHKDKPRSDEPKAARPPARYPTPASVQKAIVDGIILGPPRAHRGHRG